MRLALGTAVVILLGTGALFAQPTVGEPFAPSLELAPGERFEPDESPDWEQVVGDSLRLRAFRPGEVTITGEVIGEDGTSRRVSFVQQIGSVLVEGETEPSALANPVLRRQDPTGWILGGLATLAALFLWLPLLRRPTAGTYGVEPPRDPREVFLAAIEEARRSRTPFADLADATRRYLFALDRSLDPALTSTELVRLVGEEWGEDRAALERILSAGDLEKFSPWGSPARTEAMVRAARGLTGQRDPINGESAA